MPLVFILVIAALLAQQPASAPAPASSLDFAFFRDRVQPIFLAKRPGHARCISCHSTGTPLRLQPLSPGSTTWDEEQSRRNFEAVLREVSPGDPLASRLLVHPLAAEAGGDHFHNGGKHWASQNDSEWQTLAAWVRTGSAATASTALRSVDFESYRTRVEPIFMKSREGQGSDRACFACHTTVASRLRLQPLAPGTTSWSEEQSRRNFERVAQLVAPGDPLKSPLLLRPLAVEAGGDPSHTGGKFWASQNDPEWQMLAAWVRTLSPAANASVPAPLDFEFFRTRVQPIFMAKRPGHARCISCHSTGTPLRLQRLSPGSTTWDEEQSRKNFEAVLREVVPGDPLASRLLVHPLATDAGGDHFHNGGKHWTSQNDAEWQILAAWVRRQTTGTSGR